MSAGRNSGMRMSTQDVTQILQGMQPNAPRAPDALLELVYDQLRKIAQQRLAEERKGHTLQATALVHEAYMRLVGDGPVDWQGRAHFFAAAAEAMRRILIEHARARGRIKRGGPGKDRRRVSLNVVDLAVEGDPDDILALDEAVKRLEAKDPDLGRVVRLRFYAGLSELEVAEALGVTDRTVRREWSAARAWLQRELVSAPD